MEYKQGEEDWLEEKSNELYEAAMYDPIMIDDLQEICKEYAKKFNESNNVQEKPEK